MRDIFRTMWSMSSLHFNCLLIIKPNRLKFSTHSITLLSICINGIGVCFLPTKKTINLDLEIFSESLFTLNHIESFASSALIRSVL